MVTTRKSAPSAGRRGFKSPFACLLAVILAMVLTTPFLQDYIHCGRFIARSPQVTQDVIIAAVVVYLLMALMWSYAYALLAYYQPGAFSALEGLDRDSRQFFLYYSFVTLTTLGFGDITPLTEKAKSLTVLEAFIGQVYLVVVLAWLVGMHVSRKSKQKVSPKGLWVRFLLRGRKGTITMNRWFNMLRVFIRQRPALERDLKFLIVSKGIR